MNDYEKLANQGTAIPSWNGPTGDFHMADVKTGIVVMFHNTDDPGYEMWYALMTDLHAEGQATFAWEKQGIGFNVQVPLRG